MYGETGDGDEPPTEGEQAPATGLVADEETSKRKFAREFSPGQEADAVKEELNRRDWPDDY